MSAAASLPAKVRPRFFQHGRQSSCPIAVYHQPRWNNICSGELGTEFVNSTHAVFEFRGRLCLATLRDSVRLLVARHAILASHVVETTAGPHFRFNSEPEIEVYSVDLSSTHNSRTRAAQIAGGLVWKPWARSDSDWFRVFAISMGRWEHIIGFAVHHFICDGWSTAIVKADLLALYAALMAGRTAPLPELPIQYSDYVIGMNDWIASGGADASAAYWREHLRSAPPTRIPPDFHPPPEAAGALASHSDHLPGDVVAQLRDLSRSEGLLMNAIVVAAVAASMACLSGSSDIVVVNLVSGRTQPTLLGLVGALFDWMAVRVSVSMDMTFPALASRVQRTLLRSSQHQPYPYQLVKLALPDIGASALAPMVNFMDGGNDPGLRPALRSIRPFALPPAPPSSPTAGRYNGFHTLVRIDATGLHATTEYSSVLYKDETAACFVRTLCGLLERALRQPQLQLCSLAHAQQSQ